MSDWVDQWQVHGLEERLRRIESRAEQAARDSERASEEANARIDRLQSRVQQLEQRVEELSTVPAEDLATHEQVGADGFPEETGR